MKHFEFTGDAMEAKGRALLRDSQLVSREPDLQAIFPSLKMFPFPPGPTWHGPCVTNTAHFLLLPPLATFL